MIFVSFAASFSATGANRFAEHPNALFCVDVRPSGADEESGPFLPELRWAISGDHWWRREGALERPELLDLLAEAEIQPGPLVVGDRVLFQARSYQGEVDAWLIAVDLSSGEPQWVRQLGRGNELAPGAMRFSSRVGPVSGAQPLVGVEGRVFAGTHLGLGALLDVADGRWLWSVSNRRPEEVGEAWSGDRPLAFEGARGPELVWAPADSDRLYHLRARPLGPGEGPFLDPPSSRGNATALLGADPAETLLLSTHGRHRALSAWAREGGGRVDSLYLGAAENFSGTGLMSAQRALFASDAGLYVLDRERELYLAVEQRALSSDWGAPGGSVHARGSLVAVLGLHELWTFRAR